VKLAPLPISDRSDAALVRDARDGKPEAFNALVRRWERKVYSYLVHLTGQPEDALDLCQEVFVSAYKHLGRLRDPEGFRPWLFQIAHNTACSEMRRVLGHQFDQQVEVADEAGAARTPSSSLPGNRTGWEQGELKLLVDKALAVLSVEQREAIILKVYQGFKFTEIAEIQNCPVSTVKTRVYAGFEQLRRFLEP
jgi:RNA polymerase sigma-70 factor, ECF subfamily